MLALAAAATGGLVARAFADDPRGGGRQPQPNAPADLSELQNILQTPGKMNHGLFSFGIVRNDITNVILKGVPIKPSFLIDGNIYFQRLGNGQAIMNADFPPRAQEIDPFIDQLLMHNIVLQAEHQYFYDFTPAVWFIHCRAKGNLQEIAGGIKAALTVTSTPFPQRRPANPRTPLPSGELGRIVSAAPSVGDDGVGKLHVPHPGSITLGGVPVNSYLNIAVSIHFQPHDGEMAAAAVDFGMFANEVMPVMKTMRSLGWDIGCLYNHETDEKPQLYFSHQFKTGEAKQLAREIRQGLNCLHSKA